MHDAETNSLHPIMVVITLLEKSQLRIACNALLDQCCTDKCYIFFDLLQMFFNATKQSNARTFTTAQCSMSWCHAALSFHKSNFHCTHGDTKAMLCRHDIRDNYWSGVNETLCFGHECSWQHPILGLFATTLSPGKKKKSLWHPGTAGWWKTS